MTKQNEMPENIWISDAKGSYCRVWGMPVFGDDNKAATEYIRKDKYDALNTKLVEASERLEDMLDGDDGQAWNTRTPSEKPIGEDVREAFEAWAETRGLDLKTTTDAWEHCVYAHSHIDAMYTGFKAALEQLGGE